MRFAGIDIRNWHRPLSAYMACFLKNGLLLRAFEEPEPVDAEPAAHAAYVRVPWFTVMAWEKPA